METWYIEDRLLCVKHEGIDSEFTHSSGCVFFDLDHPHREPCGVCSQSHRVDPQQGILFIHGTLYQVDLKRQTKTPLE